MARRFLAPTSTCSLVGPSPAYVSGGYVWFGVAAASDQSACVAFYNGSTAVMTQHLWTVVATSGHLLGEPMFGPFKVSDSLVYAQVTGTRASALVSYMAS